MSNFKSLAKRKRELAKLDKRNAKDQKRALRKAERSGTDVGAAGPVLGAVTAPAILANHRPAVGAAVAPSTARKPATLAEAVELWKKTKIEKPKKR
jgi:hypothetical protein